jgi:hypothetical protein
MPPLKVPRNQPTAPRTIILRINAVRLSPLLPLPSPIAVADNQPPAPVAVQYDSLPGPGLFHSRDGGSGSDWLTNFNLWAQYRHLADET